MKNPILRQAIVGLVLGSALLAVPVSATQITAPGSATTTVDYTVTSTYTVVIPASLSVSTAGTYVGSSNNVFINSNSAIAPTGSITVSLPAQTFTATDATSASTIPFTVKYTNKLNTDAAGGPTSITEVVSGSPVTLLQQTGAEIGAVTPEDDPSATTGNAAISATVQATVTSDQLAAADVSGSHTGVITFAVTASNP